MNFDFLKINLYHLLFGQFILGSVLMDLFLAYQKGIPKKNLHIES